MKSALLAFILSVLVTAGMDKSAASGYLMGGVLAIAALVYLIYCLVKAEKF